MHFQAPQETAAIEQMVLAQQEDSTSGSTIARGAGGFASQNLTSGGAPVTAAQWQQHTVVVGSVNGSEPRAAEQPTGVELVRALQTQLQRVGCYDAAVDGDWGPKSKQAMSSFTSRINAGLVTGDPDQSVLSILQGYSGQACGSSPGNMLAGGDSTDPAQRPAPLPGRMAVGAPADDIGAYVPITREAASDASSNSSPAPAPRVTRRVRAAGSSSRRAAPARQNNNWARSFFDRVERMH